MNMTTKQKALIVAGLISLGFGIGYFAKPTKVETRTVEIIKTDTTKEEAKNKIVYKERIVYKDGTVKEVEQTEDSSNTKEHSSTDTNRSSEKIVKNDVGLNLSLLAIVPANNIKEKPEYAIHVTKRVLSNITIGAFSSTQKTLGLSLGVSF